MKKNYNIRDVAKLAAVSPGTVSRVLNNRIGNMIISESTQDRIRKAAKQLGYVPNINALRLFSKYSNVVGLVIPHYTETPVFFDHHLNGILVGIEQVLNRENYKLMIFFNDNKFSENQEHLNLYKTRMVDGLLIWGAKHEDFWSSLDPEEHPAVFLSSIPDNVREKEPLFALDYRMSGYNLGKYLLSRSYRKITFCCLKQEDSIQSAMRLGLHQAISENGGRPEDVLNEFRVNDYTPADAITAMEAWRRGEIDTEVFVFAGSAMADGAMLYCRRNNIGIPQDIALASCDAKPADKIWQDYAPTGCHGDDIRLGSNAMLSLLARIRGKEDTVPRLVETTLFAGKTTR